MDLTPARWTLDGVAQKVLNWEVVLATRDYSGSQLIRSVE
jgi:hypothetical protein